jgi:hypothetical protein
MEATFQMCQFLITEQFLIEFFRGSADSGCKAIPWGSRGIKQEAATCSMGKSKKRTAGEAFADASNR